MSRKTCLILLRAKRPMLGSSFHSDSVMTVYFAWYLDGPAVVSVNIFVRSISKIDDVTMVSHIRTDWAASSLLIV